MRRFIWILPYLILLLSSVAAIKSLFTPGLFTAHDSESHVTRIMEFDQAIRDGQFPPRWAGRYFGGLGSPVMMLNYQLPYWTAQLFMSVKNDPILAYKCTLGFSYILSALVAFFVFRKTGTTLSAFLAAFLYTWAPYRFVDIYVRGAIGESYQFVFPPLLLLGIESRSLLLTSAAFAALFLTHPVASAGYSAFFLVYALVSIPQVKRSWQEVRQALLFFARSFGLAVLIASFSIIPTLFLTRYTHYSPLNSHPFNHYPTLKQLLVGAWGYGFSTEDSHDLLSFRLGYAQLTLLALVLLRMVEWIPRRRTLALDERRALLMALGIFGMMFLMLPISKPVWLLLGLQNIIDFPWRLLLFTVFFAAWLTNWFVSRIQGAKRFLVVAVILFISIRGNSNHIHINAIWPWGIEHYQQDMGTGDAFGEYASKWRTNQSSLLVRDRIQLLQEGGEVKMDRNRSHDLAATITSSQSTKMRFAVMYFPGWSFAIDGRTQALPGPLCQITTDRTTEVEHNISGMVDCDLSAGTHQVSAYFHPPTALTIGIMFSTLGVGIWLWYAYRSSSPRLMKKKQLSLSSKR